MARVRVLVGTRKGAFILSADGGHKDWKIDGPHFGGWEIYHFNGGESWQPVNRGFHSDFVPEPEGETGHCVHRLAMHPSHPDVLFMQNHRNVMRSDDGGDSWTKVSGNLPSDFGFPINMHSREPETVYVVPMKGDSLSSVEPSGTTRPARGEEPFLIVGSVGGGL